MKKATIALLGIGARLLAVSNLVAMAGAIWLLVLGKWPVVLIGFIAMGVSALPLSLACLPSMAFAVPAIEFARNGRMRLAGALGFLSLLYTVLIVGGWGVVVLWLVIKASSGASVLPFLLWGLGVSVAPWAVMARSNEQSGGNEFSLISILFLQVGYVGGASMILLEQSFVSGSLVVASVMTICAVVQGSLAEREDLYGEAA